jgi:hypothetical protein
MKGLSLFRSLCGILATTAIIASIAIRSPAQTGGAGGGGTPPVFRLTVKIVSPTNGEFFAAPATIPIIADVQDYGYYPNHVWFYSGTNLLAQMIMDPFSTNETNGLVVPVEYDWTGVPPGAYSLTVVVEDTGGLTITSAPVNVTVLKLVPPPPQVSIVIPTNGATFTSPADIAILAKASDPGGFVRTVEFFEGTNTLGIVTNNPIVAEPLTPPSADGSTVYPAGLFELVWSNALAGNYTLTAVATDNSGNTGTSAPVNITVATTPPPPPTNLPPVVAIEIPTNGATLPANANIEICASAFDPDGFVTTVEFFAGTNSIGIVSNYPIAVADMPNTGLPPFHLLCMVWSNALPGNYVLTAVATDNGGATGTSAPVNITVTTNLPPPTNIPPVVAIETPVNGEVFAAPANIPIVAFAHDPDGFVRTVEFFAGTKSLGIVTNWPIAVDAPISSTAGIVYPVSSPFHILWSGVPAGSYTLTAVATDNGGATATSAPVNITVVTNVGAPPVVTIYATDPIASVCTNFPCFRPVTTAVNYMTGTNTATFLVRRVGSTNNELTVDYKIGGTASNGVDYVALPGYVTIPAGRRFALVTIYPLKAAHESAAMPYLTVILALTEPPPPLSPINQPPPYIVGWPGKAEAIILEECGIALPVTGILPDSSFNVCLPAANGMDFRVEVSSNLVNWVPVCTNTVVKGAVQFVDPEAGAYGTRYYRAVHAFGAAEY